MAASHAQGVQENLLQDPTLCNLIREKRWKEAWELVARDPTAPYNAKVGQDIGQMLLPLHELCRMVNFIDHVEDEEFSDEDDEEMFCDEDRETNQEIYRLARFMILQSQTVETPIFHPGVDTGDDIVAWTRLERHQSILSLKEMSGNTPLHVLCDKSADTTMMKIIFECCPLEKSSVTESATARDLVRMENGNDCNPLHFLAEGSCPFSSLKLMLQYCSPRDETEGLDPRLLWDEDGDVPLHWAFVHGVSPRRLKVLLSGCHDSLSCVNNDDILPMQEYMQEHCSYIDFMNDDEKQRLWNDMQALLKTVTGYQDDDTWSPLHAIASGVAFIPEAFWMMGFEFERANLYTYNDDGLLPLHVAVSSPPGVSSYMNNTMREIVLSSLEAPKMPTSRGRMALHLAVESKQVSGVIVALLSLDPSALLTIDPITSLPPFMLAAVDENNTLDTVYSLLREDPSIVQSMIR